MDLHLETPQTFPAFPYDPPYDIQTSLMRHLYESIEQKKVTIVESPTGTGKTLTLLCASLTWLMDEKDRARKGKMKEVVGDDNLGAKDWVVEQSLARVRRELEADEQEYEGRLVQARKREEILRRAAKGRAVKRKKLGHDPATPDIRKDEDDEQFLPETDQGTDEGKMHISPALRVLMAKVEGSSRTKSKNYLDEDEEITCTKIYYASRTHSQLSQVLPELSRLKLPSHLSVTNHHPLDPHSIPQKRTISDLDDGVYDASPSMRTTRAVSLGSRKQLCINDSLRAKVHDLDEACRELLGEKEGKRCEFLPPVGEEERMLDFRDQVLASPKDIEDLAEAGRLAHTCPYFGSRRAIPQAELVTLPYNLLLQKSAREALGINLKDQIILIDEAHNLIPTLLSLSTAILNYSTLSTSFQQVCIYVSRFKTRLSAVNMLHLKRLVVFLDSLKKYVETWKSQKDREKNPTEVMTVVQLIERMGRKVSGINLLEIESYLKRSKIARKIAGYSISRAEKEADPKSKRLIKKGAIPPLHMVEDFMLSLTNTNTDGRITLSLINGSRKDTTVELKYQLLNPSPNFMEVVEEARSVVLAGGTMSPIPDVTNQLFSTLPSEKITSFSCGHIIPEQNLQTLVVGKGPTGIELEFKANKQSDPATIAQLGQILLNFASIVPAGLIVFFPSYKFLNTTKSLWTSSGLLSKLAAKKEVFFEPEESSQVETVLQGYGEAATKPKEGKKGAILFAVIGAKLSEGLNFADDLARGVVIVGLPFANLGSPELQERMRYVKRLEEQRGPVAREKGQKDAAAELYENMCMNAVNQSIGEF
ncbi:DNA repair helicase [Pholiota conissans]|uniref:ATP-dependent DNA helicase CHL1 n=1 Tax=Pholiota conissans TaxID=109636 RepID=A0A9P5ZD42_9AGAR|nr:DNA repair helicase [Pholiota conissans]